MNQEIYNKIVELVKKANCLSPIEMGILSTNNTELVKLNETHIEVLKDNLNIGIRANEGLGRNVDDLKKLLTSIEKITDEKIYSLNLKVPSRKIYTIYVDKDLQDVLGIL